MNSIRGEVDVTGPAACFVSGALSKAGVIRHVGYEKVDQAIHKSARHQALERSMTAHHLSHLRRLHHLREPP